MNERMTTLLGMVTTVVAAHLSHNNVANNDVSGFIDGVFTTLERLSGDAPVALVVEAPAARPEPAVSIRASVKPDYIVDLFDGTKLKSMKRTIMRKHQMTPEQYRAYWDLPRDYPMVAPGYAQKRSELALKIGFGRKRATAATGGDEAAPATPTKPKAVRAPRATKKVAAPATAEAGEQREATA